MATREPGPRRVARGESDWLTLGQAAKYLGVAQSTIRKWSDLGRVPAFYTPGGHRRYKRADLDAFLERSGPGKPARGPLILLVVMMPQVDGWEMLRRVQERHGVGSIPVIMFSGQLDVGHEAAERGAQGFVGKPFDLRAMIEQTKQIVPA